MPIVRDKYVKKRRQVVRFFQHSQTMEPLSKFNQGHGEVSASRLPKLDKQITVDLP
jgi:hypothetical protein